jgi:ribonuclease HII
VVAAAVVLPAGFPVDRLSDSKQIRETERYELETLIRHGAARWGISCAWHDEIDALNIHHATLLAMQRAFAAMLGLPAPAHADGSAADPAVGAPTPAPDIDRMGLTEAGGTDAAPQTDEPAGRVYVDGRFAPQLPWPAEAVVGGDRTIAEVQAASILAKTSRDRWMIAFAERIPGYGFERHKGYPTADHRRALSDLGPSPIHRLSFRMTPSASA